MAQVLLFSPPNFRGVITDTPSGTGYSTAPGRTIAADERDVALLLTYGFSSAAPPVSTDGTSLSIYDQNGDSVTSIGTLTFEGVTVSGTTPSGIVNMTVIRGADAVVGTAAATGVTLSAGFAVSGQSGAYNQSGGYFYAVAGDGASATQNVPGPYYAGGVQFRGGNGGKGRISFYGGGAGYSTYGGGPIYIFGGQGNNGVGAYGLGAGVIIGAGASHGTFDGKDITLLGATSDGGTGGSINLDPSTDGVTDTGTVKINGDPSLIKLAALSWIAGETLDARTIGISIRAALVTAVIVRLDAANGAAGTLVVNQCPSGTAPADGTVLTTDSADLNGTPNTNQTLTLSATLTDLQIAAGTAFCTSTTGTLTLCAGCIEVWGAPQ